MSFPLENVSGPHKSGVGGFPPCSQNAVHFPCHATHPMEWRWSVSTTGLIAALRPVCMAVFWCGMCASPLQFAAAAFPLPAVALG